MAGREYQVVSQPGYAVDYTKANLIQLIRDGYGVYDENAQGETLTQIQSYEYRNADTVYFALNETGYEVGSLSVGIRPNTGNDPFWKTLQLILQKEIDISFLACEMYGIVVHPQVRREGVASRLLRRMIEDLNPQIIFGQTNVPAVAHLRSKAVKLHNYRTFYGFYETTPSLGYEKASDGAPFIQASFIAQEAEPNEAGIYYVSTHILPPNIPDIENFPLEIQRAFEPVQEAQKATEREQTAVTVLISIQDKFLRQVAS